MIKTIFALLVLHCAISSTWAQHAGTYDFHPPLKIPLVLSSNFGELRPNHFHMGLDFKTNNRIGYRLYAIEEGYVSRIKVSTYGYGKVVYIDHPNGLTSVYAHCSEFKGAIDSIVQARQNAEQNYEVEIFPGRNVIPVKRGEVIALSGNTGGSTAPHLHFEIRDTKTEHALNPLFYGFPMADHRAPELRRVKIYGLTKDGYRIPGKAIEKSVTKAGTQYTVSGDNVSISSSFLTKTGGIGFAFDVIDRFDGANNPCGLYSGVLIVDGDTLFGHKTDRVPFESTRYVNSHKDYEAYQSLRRKYHKCFSTTENDLPIYLNESHGLLRTSPGQSHQIKYIATDAAGNVSVLAFTLKVNPGELNSTQFGAFQSDVLHPQQPFEFEGNTCKIEMGYATVYEPLRINHDKLCSTIGEPEVPVNRAYKIKVKVDGVQDGKHYLKMVTSKGRSRVLHVTYEDGWAITTSKYFGSFTLLRDETKPNVALLRYTRSIPASAETISWSISDAHSGIDDYDLYIDGKWYLLEYEYKTGQVTFNKPQNFKGEKEVKVVVKDACGNTQVQEYNLTFL